MDNQIFWSIIAKLDWGQTAQAILTPAALELSNMTEEAIFGFHDLLNEKLYLLDNEKFTYNYHIKSEGTEGGQKYYFSADSFLYVRCYVVAQGKEFYENVFNNIYTMPIDKDFEWLLTLPSVAWTLKKGQDTYDYFPALWCETYSNIEGWNNINSLKAQISYPPQYLMRHIGTNAQTKI